MLRKLRSRSVTAQSGPCRRASVTSRRPICREGIVLNGAKNSASDLSLCSRISFRRRFSTTQLPSALRCATPVNAPRATSAPILLSVTRSWSILPSINTLVVGTSFSVNELALSRICALLPRILPASGLQGMTPPLTRCALRVHSLPGLLSAISCNCRRSAWNGSGAVCWERFSVPFCKRMVSTCSGSVIWRLLSPISTVLATSVAG